jgi:hypothetical protein
VGLAILLSNVISIETLLSFQIATAGDNDKQVMFSGLCKHHFNADVNRTEPSPSVVTVSDYFGRFFIIAP